MLTSTALVMSCRQAAAHTCLKVGATRSLLMQSLWRPDGQRVPTSQVQIKCRPSAAATVPRPPGMLSVAETRNPAATCRATGWTARMTVSMRAPHAAGPHQAEGDPLCLTWASPCTDRPITRAFRELSAISDARTSTSSRTVEKLMGASNLD